MSPDQQPRRCGPEEIGAAAALLHAFNTEFEAPSPGEAVLTARLAGLAANPAIAVHLAGRPPIAVAVTTFRPSVWEAGPTALLEELYVRPHHRSEGIGTRLLASVVADARAAGARTMEINVDAGDHDAHRFYRRHGFSDIDPDTGDRSFYLYRRI